MRPFKRSLEVEHDVIVAGIGQAEFHITTDHGAEPGLDIGAAPGPLCQQIKEHFKAPHPDHEVEFVLVGIVVAVVPKNWMTCGAFPLPPSRICGIIIPLVCLPCPWITRYGFTPRPAPPASPRWWGTHGGTWTHGPRPGRRRCLARRYHS